MGTICNNNFPFLSKSPFFGLNVTLTLATPNQHYSTYYYYSLPMPLLILIKVERKGDSGYKVNHLNYNDF